MALPEAVSSGLLKVGEMAAAMAAAFVALRFAMLKFKLMRQQLALERAVADSVEVQKTGFIESEVIGWSPDQMTQHCARCGGEPVFDPGMMDWTCPTCGAANEGGQDLDPSDPDNYESPEGLRGGFDIENSESGFDDDDYDNGASTAVAVVPGGEADDEGDGFGVCRACGRAMDQMAVEVGMCNHCGAFIDPADEGAGIYPPGYDLPSMSLVECEECGVMFDPTTSRSNKLCSSCFDPGDDDD